MITVTIPGRPIRWKRARVQRNRFFDCQVENKNSIALCVLSQISPRSPFTCPVRVYFEFGMPIPSTWSKKRKKEALKLPHRRRPDLSNLVKFYEDALNNVLWEDDSLICDMRAVRIYSDEPKTVITVMEQHEINHEGEE